MSVMERKEILSRYLDGKADELFINMIYAMMEQYEANKSLELNESELQAYNVELDQAVKEIENGEFIPHEQVVEASKKW